MNLGEFFLVVGVGITKLVDWIRSSFDKQHRVPKGYWILLPQAIAIGVAFGISHSPQALKFLNLPASPQTFATILAGIGLGGVSSFWHEALSALSGVTGDAGTPLGLKLARKPEIPQ